LLGTAGIDLPTVTLFRQLQRYATHRAGAGGGRTTNTASRFQAMAAKTNSSWAASRAAQSKPVEPQDALEVCKPHLDFLPLTSQLLEALGTTEGAGNVAGALTDIAWDLARWLLGSTAV
jgi:hypothetical protein